MAFELSEKLVGQLLQLPTEQRQELIDRLIESLDLPGNDVPSDEWEAAWQHQRERRSAGLASGAVSPVLANDMFHEIEKRQRARNDS